MGAHTLTVTTSQLMLKPKQDLGGIRIVCRSFSKPKTPDTSCWEKWLLSTCLSMYQSPHAYQCMHCHICLRPTQAYAETQIHGTHTADPAACTRSTPFWGWYIRAWGRWMLLLFTCSSFLLRNKSLLGWHPCSLVLYLWLSSECFKDLKSWWRQKEE